ncbi:isoprenoid synthase domain-containing protein [Boletus reticuloceps]|uniref:Terpene synthase n=1 Tax=Boletus reticuloceps TaxID=495285 RepID=A0A8I3AF28_9AGAM|nr:isoprenoid synthase domain-containing protein [Boletus reticuloceps]
MDDRGIDNVANVVMNTIHHPHTYRSPARLNRMTKSSFYKRIMQTASPGTCRRFKETMKLYFQAIQQQALDRANGTIPDLESYITLRRDTVDANLAGEATNDFVAWSNDIFSYDVEQSKDQTHNMIDVIMHEQGLGLQDAIDLVGDYCKRALDRFVHDRANLPSLGPAIDADVRVYVDGLTRWMVGSLHWSFETERYFGKVGKQIKATRLVNLRTKTVHAQVRV